MVCLGFKPGAQMKPRSYGGHPKKTLLNQLALIEFVQHKLMLL